MSTHLSAAVGDAERRESMGEPYAPTGHGLPVTCQNKVLEFPSWTMHDIARSAQTPSCKPHPWIGLYHRASVKVRHWRSDVLHVGAKPGTLHIY